MLGAGGDQDLSGRRGDPVRGVPGRDGVAERADAQGVVAEARQQRGQFGQGRGKGPVHHFAAGGQGGVGQVQDPVRHGQAGSAAQRRGAVAAAGMRRPLARDAAAAPAALAAAEETLLSHQGVRRGHRRAADAKGRGQRTLARQGDVQGDAAVEDEQADDVGQLAVGRSGANVPLAQQTGQRPGSERNRHVASISNWLWITRPVFVEDGHHVDPQTPPAPDRPRHVRRFARHVHPGGARAGPLGRFPPGARHQDRSEHRHGCGDCQLPGAAPLDSAAPVARSRHAGQRCAGGRLRRRRSGPDPSVLTPGRSDRHARRSRPAQRHRLGLLHRRPPGPRPQGRPHDGPGPAHRLVRAGVPDRHRSGGSRRRLAAGRIGGRRHRAVRPCDRPAGAVAPAAVHRAGSEAARAPGGAPIRPSRHPRRLADADDAEFAGDAQISADTGIPVSSGTSRVEGSVPRQGSDYCGSGPGSGWHSGRSRCPVPR